MGDIAIVNMACISYTAYMAKEPTFTVKKLVYLSEDMASAISDYRFEQRLNSENEAIRRLIEIGLEAQKKPK